MSRELLRHFFGGFVRLHILYHAAKEPIWGTAMMEELRRHGYKMGPGTLYPILHQLEEDGILVSNDNVVAGKRRKEYRITPKGKRVLKSARAKLRELVDEVLKDKDRMHED
ncbi:PadR family transcriptional regulator [Thermostilla marina]